jgi:dienelactone hydrolase
MRLGADRSVRFAKAQFLALAVCVLAFPSLAAGGERPIVTGEVAFEPSAAEASLPAAFRLAAHRFVFRQEAIETASTEMDISRVTFPSPVETAHPENNTVHCEYFRPLTEGKHRAVVVLHILGGDFDLARLFSRYLASRNVAALFLKMPYYGERRPAEGRVRMVSVDPQQTVAGMQQAVLDIRRAAAWLASREEVDPEGLGIFGISLGGITSALTASVEPRFSRVCLMLAGGDIAQVSWQRPEFARLRDKWIADGGTRESYVDLLKTIDPVTYARPVAGREVLMINATHDEIIPRACTESLRRAFGEPKIIWYNAGHISCMRHILDGLANVANFFQKP